MSERHPLSWLILGGAAGAGATYLFDPQRGAGRRARLANKVRALGHRAQGASARMPDRRVLEIGGGVLLALVGFIRGGLIGAGAQLAGVALSAHGATQKPVSRRMRIHKEITVRAPVREVYEFWSHYENFPRFMKHVLEITGDDGARSHWKVAGPGGRTYEWEAEELVRIPNRTIAWRSLPGAVVEHHGRVHFEAMDARTTRINVHLAYEPPIGTLTDADLQAMKRQLETAAARTIAAEQLLDQPT